MPAPSRREKIPDGGGGRERALFPPMRSFRRNQKASRDISI